LADTDIRQGSFVKELRKSSVNASDTRPSLFAEVSMHDSRAKPESAAPSGDRATVPLLRTAVPNRIGRIGRVVGTLVPAIALAACAVQVTNTQPAQELERLSRPAGSVYVGWRVFQDRCAGCHGPAASGGPGAPDLLPIVRTMGPRQFVDVVLRRYDWKLPASQAAASSAAREALLDRVVQRREEPLTMPAWAGDPPVQAHIVDLYAYLSARAAGTQGTDRPTP